ncbi:MAG: hypothetical protein NTV93_16020 [Verrucomicrobia bacterium]|nr:hypothetical protein [Verrucomicrobiota bacterium]
MSTIPAIPASAPTLQLDLEDGVPLPIAALPSNTPVTPAVAQSTESIADKFQKEVQDALASPSASDQTVSEAYWDAQERADQNYWVLYGDTAYNQQKINAQLEALGLTGR